jgi:hypothetical protein
MCIESKLFRTEVAVELRSKLIIAIVPVPFHAYLIGAQTSIKTQSTINQFYDIILIDDKRLVQVLRI